MRSVMVVNGSYYLANRHQGFRQPGRGDPNAEPVQPFLTAVATGHSSSSRRTTPDRPDVRGAGGHGGGVELRVTVQPGAADREGEQLGMFRFGGSTHCLLFRPGVELCSTSTGQQSRAGGDQPEDQRRWRGSNNPAAAGRKARKAAFGRNAVQIRHF